ncbi:MAG TPA: hypothetical protein VKI44_33610 [Acetobacteraceae bacterium]|nr:hypothetical protein [Acetobacteraceae bacterium]
MSAAATLHAWLYRLTASAPTAWHYDRLFRWMVIGAGVSLTVFVLRPHNPATSRPIASAPISSVPASLGPTYGAAGTPLAPPPPPALPNITPGRSLDGVTITPAPVDSFGSAPPATRK